MPENFSETDKENLKKANQSAWFLGQDLEMLTSSNNPLLAHTAAGLLRKLSELHHEIGAIACLANSKVDSAIEDDDLVSPGSEEGAASCSQPTPSG